jgi:hypothetical protein
MEAVPIDLDVSSDGEVSRTDKVQVFIHILVLPSLQELPFHHSRVLLGWLEDGDGVVSEVEGNNESAVDVLRNLGVEARGESQHFLVVVNVLEEVALGLVWEKFENVS